MSQDQQPEQAPEQQWVKFSLHNPGDDAEERLIFGCWIGHLKTMGEYRRFTKQQWRAKREELGDLVKRCRPIILRSVKDEPCYGFICSEYQGNDQVLHFCYIRSMWRQRGFGSTLMGVSFNRLGKDPIYFTHPMRAVHHLKDKWKLSYKPKRIYWREDDYSFNAPGPGGYPRV